MNNSNYSFTVICKGGIDIGMGHLYRAKTFSKKVFELGYDLNVIAITDKNVRNSLYDITEYTSFVDNDKEAYDKLCERKTDILIFDTISFESRYIIKLKKQVKHIASISPVFDAMPFVDSLFTRFNYKDKKSIQNIEVYTGLKYVIINDTCQKISDEQYKRNLQNTPFSVGISMGGGDAPNKTKEIIKAIVNVKKSLTLWVILGEGYSHSYTDLVDIIKNDKKHEIILARTNQSMWRLLNNCVLAITAGGVTYTETVYAGLPVINMFDSEDHYNRIPDIFKQNNIGNNLGVLNNQSLNQFTHLLNKLLISKDELLEMRNRTLNIVDGFGSERIISKLMQVLKLKIRK